MGLQSPPVLMLHLRQLDRFLKRHGLHSAARTYVRPPAYRLVEISSHWITLRRTLITFELVNR